MKIAIKYILLIILVISYFIFEPIKRALDYELNPIGISYVFGKNMYDEVLVSNEFIEVLDYYLEDDTLYILPINGEIKLPFNISIYKVYSDSIVVVDNEAKYHLYGVNNRKKNLYQYVYAKETIGYSADYYFIKSDNLDYIISKIIINYEII